MSRLGGKSRTPINPCGPPTNLHVHRFQTMSEAVRSSRRQIWKRPSPDDGERVARIGNRPVDGDKARLAIAMGASERLIDDAIASDPRLSKKAQWLRRDEGEHCDSALLAEGDDQPFYKRIRNVVNDETKAGEPFRVVVSTDDNKVPEGTAAAFIATVRIVQQFVPVEVWLQGAWLTDDRCKGFVFHVPLVQGDMDFSRLEFCISDSQRDMFSYMVMSTHCVLDLKESWNSCAERANQSHLPEAPGWKHFVAHDGIRPEGGSIAAMAACWLGWESAWEVSENQTESASAALQSLS